MDASLGGSSTPPPWHIDAVGERPPRQRHDERDYAMLASRQRTVLTPTMRALDGCIIRSALRRRPRGVSYERAPLWSERATDLAGVRLKHPQAVENSIEAGVVDGGALGQSVISQAEDDGWLPAPGQHVAAIERPQPGTPAAENDA